MGCTGNKRWEVVSVGLLLLAMAAILPQSQGCPDTCFCLDTFVTCSDFTQLDLGQLPEGTDTLILTRGELEEIPPGFLASAPSLKMLEFHSVRCRTVKSLAFSGLKELDLFLIATSTFDVIEADSFKGLTDISKLHLTESTFKRVDPNAFSHIKDVVDLRLWSNTIGQLGDHAFQGLTDVISFQFYENDVTYLGSQLFREASGLDDVTIYNNRIHRLSRDCLGDVALIAGRTVVYANTLTCDCDLAGVLDNPDFHDYLESNQCLFTGKEGEEETFRLADVSKEKLCPAVSSPGDNIVEDSSPGASSIPRQTSESVSSTSYNTRAHTLIVPSAYITTISTLSPIVSSSSSKKLEQPRSTTSYFLSSLASRKSSSTQPSTQAPLPPSTSPSAGTIPSIGFSSFPDSSFQESFSTNSPFTDSPSWIKLVSSPSLPPQHSRHPSPSTSGPGIAPESWTTASSPAVEDPTQNVARVKDTQWSSSTNDLQSLPVNPSQGKSSTPRSSDDLEENLHTVSLEVESDLVSVEAVKSAWTVANRSSDNDAASFQGNSSLGQTSNWVRVLLVNSLISVLLLNLL